MGENVLDLLCVICVLERNKWNWGDETYEMSLIYMSWLCLTLKLRWDVISWFDGKMERDVFLMG